MNEGGPKPSWNDPDVAGEVEAAPVAAEGSEMPPEELVEVQDLAAELARAVEAEGTLTPEGRDHAKEEAEMFTTEAKRTGGILGKLAGPRLRALALYGFLGLSAMAATVGVGKVERAEAASTIDWGGILKEGARGVTQIARERQAQASRERIEQMRREAELKRAEQQAEIARLRAENDLALAKMKNEQQLRGEETKLNLALVKAKSDKERAQIDARLQTVRAAIASKQTKAVEVTMEGETGTARVGVEGDAKGVGVRSAPRPEQSPRPQSSGERTENYTPVPGAEGGGTPYGGPTT